MPMINSEELIEPLARVSAAEADWSAAIEAIDRLAEEERKAAWANVKLLNEKYHTQLFSLYRELTLLVAKAESQT